MKKKLKEIFSDPYVVREIRQGLIGLAIFLGTCAVCYGVLKYRGIV